MPIPLISAVQFNVHNMQEALSFYCDVLGFELDLEEHLPQLATLKYDGFFLILNTVEKPSSNSYPSNAQVIVNIRVEDVDRMLSHLKSSGTLVLHDKPQPCPVGHYIAVKDPSGNVLELVEFNEDHTK